MSTPPLEHPSADALADLDEGLLPPAEAVGIEAHIDDCARCQDLRGTIASIPGDLRAAAGDEPMPDGVARRLSTALAAELAAEPGTTGPDAPEPHGEAEVAEPGVAEPEVAEPEVADPGAGEPEDGEPGSGQPELEEQVVTAAPTVVPLRTGPTEPTTSWPTRLLQAAAVIVVLAALGGLGYGVVSGGGGNSADRGSGGGGQADSQAGGDAIKAGRYSVTASGRDYTPDTMLAAVPSLLHGTLPAAPSESAEDAATSPPSRSSTSSASSAATDGAVRDPYRLTGGSALAECVARLVDGPETPLAVDIAKFDGKDATVIVLPSPDDPTSVDVWVVRPDCAPGVILYYGHAARS